MSDGASPLFQPAPPANPAQGVEDVKPAKKPRKPRVKPDIKPIMRADTLTSSLTASKARALEALFDSWSKTALLLGREQWRLFFETGRFNTYYDIDKVTYKAILGNAARVQMCRAAVVGQLRSWVSNRANAYRDAVVGASNAIIPPNTKHMLHVINVRQGWFDREPIVMPATADTSIAGQPIPDAVRRMARAVMRGVMARHRRPNLANISMVLDARGGAVLPPKRATQKGKVAYWARVSTMTPRETIDVPLLANAYHAARGGARTKGVAITRVKQSDRQQGTRPTFGFVVTTDIAGACVDSRAAHKAAATDMRKRGVHDDGTPYAYSIALDFGLSSLFGTSEGRLLGRSWGARLRLYDVRIQAIAKGVQRRKGKLRDNRRYQAALQDLRGFIKTEVGRVLNRLVATRKPTALVVEHLDFRSPTLSRRLNRLVSTCGRAAIKTKLADLKDRTGVQTHEVNPAYTSQTCACCGYVDTRNRATQSRFRCLWCGHAMHADLHAAVNIGRRRASSGDDHWLSKASVLEELVRAFNERKVRGLQNPRRSRHLGVPEDPRTTNPYFLDKEKREKAVRGSKVGKGSGALAPAASSQ